MFVRYDDSGESPMGRLVGCVDYLRLYQYELVIKHGAVSDSASLWCSPEAWLVPLAMRNSLAAPLSHDPSAEGPL